MHTPNMTSVISLVALVAGPFACSRPSEGTPTITKEPARAETKPRAAPKSEAESAAAALYWFLTDGEDGCTCGADLQGYVRTFQLAHDRDPLGHRPASQGPATGPLATDGYLDPSTATALATYSGHWLEPCYGAWNSRCGDVPAPRSPIVRTASIARAASAASVAGRSVGGCWRASLGDPGSRVTCTEVRATARTDASTLATLGSGVRAACGDVLAPQLIHEWIYDPRGCPRNDRVAACSAMERGDPRTTTLEWFYEGAGSVDDVRERCLASDRALVMP
jgi:hypothetical protein